MTETKKIGAPADNTSGDDHKKKEETFRVDGEQLLKKVKELINEGNVRKITIKDKKVNR